MLLLATFHCSDFGLRSLEVSLKSTRIWGSVTCNWWASHLPSLSRRMGTRLLRRGHLQLPHPRRWKVWASWSRSMEWRWKSAVRLVVARSSSQRTPKAFGFWLERNKVIPKGSVLAGFGTGQWLPESEVAEGVPFQVPEGDRTLVQLDESSFSAEAQGNQNLSIYKLLVRAESEKQLTDHRMSFLQIARKTNLPAGQDGFDVSVKTAMKFKCLRDPRAQSGEDRITSKNFFSKCLASLPTQFAKTIFRFRFERVGANFKIQRPYVVASMALSLTKDKPLRLT